MPRGWIPQDGPPPAGRPLYEQPYRNRPAQDAELRQLISHRPKPVRRWWEVRYRFTATTADEAIDLALRIRDAGRKVAGDLDGYGQLLEVHQEPEEPLLAAAETVELEEG
jgi:hypothetical protein